MDLFEKRSKNIGHLGMYAAKGDGYFYFANGEYEEWNSTGVYVYRLNELSLERWVEEWKYRRDAFLADK